MVTSTTTSISRSSSESSLADESVKSSASGCSSGGSTGVIKFLCSYGGKILPRYPDVKLRYVGGETRVVAVDRLIHFTDLLAKMGEICGREPQMITLRCQLPTEDLDALITIKSDEDLFNVIEEYDLANRYRDSPRKIRAFLNFPSLSPSPPSSLKGKSTLTSATPTSPSTASHLRISPPQSARFSKFPPRCNQVPVHLQQQQHHHQYHPCPACNGHGCGGMMMMPASASSSSSYRLQIHHSHLLHNGNHWQ